MVADKINISEFLESNLEGTNEKLEFPYLKTEK